MAKNANKVLMYGSVKIIQSVSSLFPGQKQCEIISDGRFDIHGQQVEVSTLEPTRTIQVSVTHRPSEVEMHQDLLMGFFSNPAYIPGIKASTKLKIRKTSKENVYVITFPSSEGKS